MRNLYQFGEKATLRLKMRNKQTELVKTAINNAIKKELFFRSKNDPKFGVKLGVKITPKKGLSCT